MITVAKDGSGDYTSVQEAIDSILEACSYKEQKPELKVVVTGCLAQRYQHEIVNANGGRK